MDKEFILQCEKAVEIQGRVFKKGDICCDINRVVKIFFTYNESHPFIWLPTQEQLQGMLKENDRPHLLVILFKNWFDRTQTSLDTTKFNFKSMNQLWLAFVMWELYNKTWTGKDWVL